MVRDENHLSELSNDSMNPWRRKWQSTPVLLPGKSHGQRSLVSYSPWGCQESDSTEPLHFHFHFGTQGRSRRLNDAYILQTRNGEHRTDLYSRAPQSSTQFGTPLQYSCLENPMDGGAWWAAVHGVARVGHD